MPHAALWPAGALILGIACGIATGFNPWWAALALGLALLASIVCLCTRAPGLLVCCVVAGSTAAGVALGSHADRDARHPAIVSAVHRVSDDGQVTVTGRLREDASASAGGVALSLDVETLSARSIVERVRGGIWLTVSGELASRRAPQWTAGRRLRLVARLGEAARYENPGVPDHRLALARRGSVLVGSVKSAALVDVLERGSWIAETAAAIRHFTRAKIAATVGRISPASGAIVTAILIGDRAGLDDTLERRLQEAGTYHVIAISGGNIAVFAVCLLTVGRVVRLSWRTGLAVTAAGLIAYGAVAVGGSSVSRAIVMALVYVVATALDHRSGPANALAIAAGLILCATPLALLDAGFLLTFGATSAILIGVPRALAASGTRGFAVALVALAAASFASELALLPIGAFYFSRVTFAGLVLNLLAVPLMSVVQIGGLLAVLLAAVDHRSGALIAWIPHLAADGLVRSASLVEHAPWLTWRVAAPAGWLIAAYYALLVAWVTRETWISCVIPYHRPCRLLLGSCGAGAALLVVVGPPGFGIDGHAGRLRMTVLDVGQGDATLLELPGGEALLVDAGGLGGHARFDIGERVVSPALWALGVRRLSALVLTHGDPDHIGGAPAVLDLLGAREVWEGIPVPSHPPLVRLAQRADDLGISWRSVRAGDELRIGQVTISVLHPRPPDWERRRVRNDDSVVLDVRMGDVSFVLPGDIGANVERELSGSIRPARVRVLKVAHHGSRTSTAPEFVTALRPQVAIVSCGRDNRFGHPVPDVLERLRAGGATVYRTDVHGAVTVETDGHSVDVRTFLPMTR